MQSRQPSLQLQLHHPQFTRRLSPLAIPSALSVDTNTLRTNTQQQAKNATTVMQQYITQHYAGAQDKQKSTISGPTAGPATETPTITNTTADLPAYTDSPAIGATAAHADHLTLQENTEAPLPGLIRSVTLLSLYIQDQKIS